MEKNRKEALWWGPWQIKEDQVKKDFVKVTDANIKNAKCIGRIFYIIEHERGKLYQYCGSFSLNPLMLSGKWDWPLLPFVSKPTGMSKNTHFKVYIDKDQSRDEWSNDYKILINSNLEKGNLYIKTSDPILTYTKL